MSTMDDYADDRGKKSQFDRLIHEIDRRLQDIETDEILNSQTDEELQQRGFSSQGTLAIERSEHMQARRAVGFFFPHGVEFCVYFQVKSIADIDISATTDVPAVKAGAVTITRIISDSRVTQSPQSIYGQDYLDECNLDISLQDNTLHFVPRVDGRLVISGERLYLLAENRDGSFCVRITDNNMKAQVDFVPSRGSGRMPSAHDVLRELVRQGVKRGVHAECIEQALTKVRGATTALCNVVVAEGMPAVEGKDGSVHYRFDIAPSSEEYRILPDGRIDYRKTATIPIVNKGDIVASLTEPEQGVDGFDLFGTIVKARQGESAVLCPGINVIVDENNLFRAACSGQVSLNGAVLDVFQHYVVEGSVDYGCGNVKFNGNVTVKGNVNPGFEVIADGDIEVYGTIDGAILKAGRDIRVEGGIIGCGNGSSTRICCGRDLFAKHIQNSHIEAQGDIVVKNSIVQSTIKAGGTVSIRGSKMAAIIGGSICALNGITSPNIGCEYGVRTLVEAGNDYLVRKVCDELDESILFCEKNINKIDQVFIALKTLVKNGISIDAEKQAKMIQIKEKRTQLHHTRRAMVLKKETLLKQSTKNIDAKICARETVFVDTIVKIVDKQILLRSSMTRTCFKYDFEKSEILSMRFSD